MGWFDDDKQRLLAAGAAIVAFAIFDGWALFMAGILSSLFAALWLKEKVDKLA
jgi:hypothetical protein